MGDDIGSGSVTGCLLRSHNDLKQQTELHYVTSESPKRVVAILYTE
jgi:hypothetical protein